MQSLYYYLIEFAALATLVALLAGTILSYVSKDNEDTVFWSAWILAVAFLGYWFACSEDYVRDWGGVTDEFMLYAVLAVFAGVALMSWTADLIRRLSQKS